MKRWDDRFGGQSRQQEGTMKRWADRFGGQGRQEEGP